MPSCPKCGSKHTEARIYQRESERNQKPTFLCLQCGQIFTEEES